MTHPHAEVLRAIADGVPLSEFELTCHLNDNQDVWDNMGNGTKWGSWVHEPEAWKVRRKQRTHVVNGFTVPAPMDKEPEDAARYYAATPDSIEFFNSQIWDGFKDDKRVFSRGLCFATQSAAIANAKAMLKIDPEAA